MGKLLGFDIYRFHSKCCDSTSLHFNEIWKFTFLWLIFVRYLAVHISVGMVSKPVAETAPEFQIQQEDFPALPGAQSESQRERDWDCIMGREILERKNYQRNTVTLREWMSVWFEIWRKSQINKVRKVVLYIKITRLTEEGCFWIERKIECKTGSLDERQFERREAKSLKYLPSIKDIPIM